MSGADLFVDGFPHGTREGFQQGCRGSACPEPLEGGGLSCRDAEMKSHGSYRYRKLLDRGVGALEAGRLLVAEEKRAAVAVPEVVSRGLDEEPVGRLVEEVVVAEVVERPAPKPTPPKRVLAVGSGGPGAFVPALSEAPTPEAPKEKPKRLPSVPVTDPRFPHGTLNGYQRGCKDGNACPASGGKSCVQAKRDYQNAYMARRRQEDAGVPVQAGPEVPVVDAPAVIEAASPAPVSGAPGEVFAVQRMRERLEQRGEDLRLAEAEVERLTAELERTKASLAAEIRTVEAVERAAEVQLAALRRELAKARGDLLDLVAGPAAAVLPNRVELEVAGTKIAIIVGRAA